LAAVVEKILSRGRDYVQRRFIRHADEGPKMFPAPSATLPARRGLRVCALTTGIPHA
jgi:hypothetical protein